MDREALILRNRSMTEAFHSLPFKHQARRWMLRGIAGLWPSRQSKPPERDRILLIRPDHLGDLLLTTPAIRALRQAIPRAEIHLLAGPWSAPLLANNRQLDLVLTLPFPGFTRAEKENLQSPYQLALRSANQLRSIGYSHAVILRPDHWWGALVAYLAGIPERIGYTHEDVSPFLTDALKLQHEHAILQNMRLVEYWTGGPITPDYHFTPEKTDTAYIEGYLSEWGIQPQDRLICIHPGSGTWVKRWSSANWAQVADTLTDQLSARVIFTGGDHEASLITEITALMEHPAVIAAGDTGVGQLAALFQRALVVIGPDSGPMHLAAAVKTPTVTLFGPADPVEFAPWGSPDKHFVLTSDIGCRPCRIIDWGSDHPDFHPCVREITVGRVLEAARRAAG